MEIRRNPIILVIAIMAALVIFGLILLFVATGSTPAPQSAPAEPSTQPTSAATGTPTTAPNPEAVESAESATVLKIAVDDCPGCQVTAQPTGGSVDLPPITATAADGVAEIELPTSSTLGLVFSLRSGGDGADTSQGNLVILSSGTVEPGSPQTQTQLEQAEKGAYCWAGTLLDVALVNFSVSGDSEEPGSAWADPALPTTGGSVALKDGSAAIPETLKCS